MATIEESTKPLDMKKFEPVGGGNWTPITWHPGSQPTYPTYPRFQVTSLPLSVIFSGDALRQFYRGGVPQSRIFPSQT